MIVEIECVANPHGTAANPYEYIEAAIKRIEDSGLEYEVDALGTTVEGDPDAVWALLREVHEATLTAGANSVITVIKIAQAAPHREQATIQGLVGKFRS